MIVTWMCTYLSERQILYNKMHRVQNLGLCSSGKHTISTPRAGIKTPITKILDILSPTDLTKGNNNFALESTTKKKKKRWKFSEIVSKLEFCIKCTMGRFAGCKGESPAVFGEEIQVPAGIFLSPVRDFLALQWFIFVHQNVCRENAIYFKNQH